MAMEGAQSQVSPVTLVAIMLVLAGLDLVGAIVAKEWTLGRSSWFFVAGAASFVVLFGVYAVGLRYAELSTVTFGWIVGLQVAVLVVERLRDQVELPPGKWVAIAAILVLQGYLVLAPNGGAPSDDGPFGVPHGVVEPEARTGQLTASAHGRRLPTWRPPVRRFGSGLRSCPMDSWCAIACSTSSGSGSSVDSRWRGRVRASVRRRC